MATPPSAALPSPGAETPAAPSPGRPWQDDARFGVTMLAVLLITNLALILWLPHLTPTDKSGLAPVATVSSAMPKPAQSAHPEITVYAKPEAESTPRLLKVAPPEPSRPDETAGDSDQ